MLFFPCDLCVLLRPVQFGCGFADLGHPWQKSSPNEATLTHCSRQNTCKSPVRLKKAFPRPVPRQAKADLSTAGPARVDLSTVGPAKVECQHANASPLRKSLRRDKPPRQVPGRAGIVARIAPRLPSQHWQQCPHHHGVKGSEGRPLLGVNVAFRCRGAGKSDCAILPLTTQGKPSP